LSKTFTQEKQPICSSATTAKRQKKYKKTSTPFLYKSKTPKTSQNLSTGMH
jgi:hypothetical protein